jgi:hypothetical protein
MATNADKTHELVQKAYGDVARKQSSCCGTDSSCCGESKPYTVTNVPGIVLRAVIPATPHTTTPAVTEPGKALRQLGSAPDRRPSDWPSAEQCAEKR